MHDDDLFDLLTEIEEWTPLEQKPIRLEREASALEVGEHGRASLLLAAGEHWQMRGEYDEARRCFDAALADGGETASDLVANLHALALDQDDEETAVRHLDELRAMAKRDLLSSSACHFVGETFEGRGRLREAHRWFTMPLTWTDDEDELDYFCLIGRLRVREELGLPTDRIDVLAREEREARLP